MDNDGSGAEHVLQDHRQSIDRLDAILVYTLGERFRQTQAVGRLKARFDLPPADPGREAQQIERLQQLASDAGVDPEFARKFITLIFEEVVGHHHLYRK